MQRILHPPHPTSLDLFTSSALAFPLHPLVDTTWIDPQIMGDFRDRAITLGDHPKDLSSILGANVLRSWSWHCHIPLSFSLYDIFHVYRTWGKFSILFPIHVVLGINSGSAIHQSFYGPQYRVKGSMLSLKYTIHIETGRLDAN